MTIIKLSKTGFCYGVSNALKTVNNLKDYHNTYLLGDLVHNQRVTSYLLSLGLNIVNNKSRSELLNDIPNNSKVIISAHGVSDTIYHRLRNKNCEIIDATCPFVKKSFDLIKTYLNNGYDIIFIGKKDHPETQSALDISPHVHLYNDLDKPIKNDKIAVAYQTTMSKYDIEQELLNIKQYYPGYELIKMICHETELRQNELNDCCLKNDQNNILFIVIGDKMSNNSLKLYETTKRYHNLSSIFINSIEEINSNYVKSFEKVFLASGTSTPDSLIEEIYQYLLTL